MRESGENFPRAREFLTCVCGATGEDLASAGGVAGSGWIEGTSDGEREQVGMAGRVERVVGRADVGLKPQRILSRASLQERNADFVRTGFETQASVNRASTASAAAVMFSRLALKSASPPNAPR